MLPDYEEAIAQSMKQPPPPYSQVAMATNSVIPNINVAVMNENQSVQPQTATNSASISTNHDNVQNKIPPAYDETNAHPSVSLTSDTSSNEMNPSNGERSSVTISNTNHSGRQTSQQ